MNGHEERGGQPTLEKIDVRVELVRHGLPVETVTVGFEGVVNRRELAQKIAAILELEAEEVLTALSNPECLHPEHHHGRVELVCIDLHFETESAKHHFLSSAKWGAFICGVARSSRSPTMPVRIWSCTAVVQKALRSTNRNPSENNTRGACKCGW